MPSGKNLEALLAYLRDRSAELQAIPAPARSATQVQQLAAMEEYIAKATASGAI
jgi:hypothetical protein